MNMHHNLSATHGDGVKRQNDTSEFPLESQEECCYKLCTEDIGKLTLGKEE